MSQTSAIQDLQRQRVLLEIEYLYEKSTFRKQTETKGLNRQVKRGDAWFPLKVGKSYYNSLNQLVIEVFRTADQEIEHNFEYGRPVTFFTAELKYFDFTGTVSYVEGDRMVVAVPDNAPVVQLQNTENLGVQLSFDETSYRLMFEALDRTMRAKGNRLAYLRDLFHTPLTQAKGADRVSRFSFAPMRFPWLNPTQEKAVNEVLRAKDVAIVHGKTTTLVEAIYETLHRESQVLVCAQSNMAVDWISEKLVDRGVNVLRIGNPTRVNDKMLSFTYERRFEAHPDYEMLWAIRKAIRQIRANRKRGNDNYHQKLERLKSRAAEIEIRINAELFGEARVIASTLTGSANRLLEGQKYHTLFIDEAAQALEAACWIPIRRASRVIFAGDHCQLPPTVKSLPALKGGLGKTLMECIVERLPEAVTLLGVQYRMKKYRGILDYDLPMVWVDTSDLDIHEEFVGESFGRINKIEAELTLNELKKYFTKIGKTRILEERIDVGIISPYRAQVQYLRRLIKKNEFYKPYRHLISVNTVDGFQGQERDIIVISLVRSNDEGQIGFLRDLRRMNVAITRARMKLIILGDAKTMTRHPFYKKLFEYVQAMQGLE